MAEVMGMALPANEYVVLKGRVLADIVYTALHLRLTSHLHLYVLVGQSAADSRDWEPVLIPWSRYCLNRKSANP